MLLEFYGKECSHCMRMKPFLRRLEKENGVQIQSFEIWHNDENSKNMGEYDKGLCGGVPFFFNTDTGGYICGETSYEELEKWALGESANRKTQSEKE